MDALNDLLPRLEQLNQIGAALSRERDIERLLKKQIEALHYPGFEPDPSIRAEPILLRSNAPRGGQRPAGNRPRGGNGSRNGNASRPSGTRSNAPAKPGTATHHSGNRHR